MELFFASRKEDWETISEYLSHSTNPRWAAAHLIRAVSNGLGKVDESASSLLGDIATYLEAQADRSPPLPINTLKDKP